jgi:hypothetical protein
MRQHAYQMAAASRDQRQAVHDARGDLEIHRPSANVSSAWTWMPSPSSPSHLVT